MARSFVGTSPGQRQPPPQRVNVLLSWVDVPTRPRRRKCRAAILRQPVLQLADILLISPASRTPKGIESAISRTCHHSTRPYLEWRPQVSGGSTCYHV